VPESELTPFGYAFFANAPATFAPIPDTPAPSDCVLGSGEKRQTIALDLEAILAGRVADVELRDRVVRIEGAVQRPGACERAEDISLCDGDRVLVPEVGQYQRAPQTVRIAGEVRFPGTYALEGRDETLGHLLRRAGGVTDDAFVKGAVFIRRIGNMVTDYQEQIARQVQAKAEARAELQYQLELVKAAKAAAPLLPSPGSAVAAAPAPESTSTTVVARPRKLGEIISSGRVPIDLAAILDRPRGPADVPLEDGDMLIVPRRPRTEVCHVRHLRHL